MSEHSDDNPQGGLSQAKRDNSPADPKGEAQPNKSHASLKNSDIIESNVSKNETASSLKK